MAGRDASQPLFETSDSSENDFFFQKIWVLRVVETGGGHRPKIKKSFIRPKTLSFFSLVFFPLIIFSFFSLINCVFFLGYWGFSLVFFSLVILGFLGYFMCSFQGLFYLYKRGESPSTSMQVHLSCIPLL